ncbi:MAG: amidase, partial [Deltaproteobacteria bacterium]|nr:amidase [Deltaproteobacteria bacterium]
MTDLWKLSGLEIGTLIAKREITSQEVVRTFFERIDRINPKISAYVTLCQEEALTEAKSVDETLDKGDKPSNPLFGVPVSIKDLIETKGVLTTHGSTFFKNNVPKVDAVLVERLRSAGCPILGKTNTPEFGGKFATDNMLFPPTRNPWNLERSPGGSSGGAAAQVASGLGPLAVGNDGGGSIRVPSCLCGVFGIKPQFGRVPSWPRHDAWSTLNHEGPITRTVRDASAMLDIMAGPDDRDRSSLPVPGLSYLEACEGDINGLRVAWSPDLGYGRVDPEVKTICEEAAYTFKDLGCTVEEAAPTWECPEEIFLNILVPRMAAWLEAELPEGFEEGMDPMLQVFLPLADELTSRDAMRAHFGPDVIWDVLGPFFRTYDLWLT